MSETVRSESCSLNKERSSILAVAICALISLFPCLSLIQMSLIIIRLNKPISILPIETLVCSVWLSSVATI